MTWRWERRERKLEAKRKQMPKHGKDMGEAYANAILKRVRELYPDMDVKGLTKEELYDIIEE